MSSIGGHQRQDSPMVDEMLDGAQMDVTDSEVIYKDTFKDFWITTLLFNGISFKFGWCFLLKY